MASPTVGSATTLFDVLKLSNPTLSILRPGFGSTSRCLVPSTRAMTHPAEAALQASISFATHGMAWGGVGQILVIAKPLIAMKVPPRRSRVSCSCPPVT